MHLYCGLFLFGLSYGQTGTGKTFTMEGERSPNEEFTWEEVIFKSEFGSSAAVQVGHVSNQWLFKGAISCVHLVFSFLKASNVASVTI